MQDTSASGHLLVITGNMMSGKTEELIARIRTLSRVQQIRARAASREGHPYAQRQIGVYKHSLDLRFGTNDIASHGGEHIRATPVRSARELLSQVMTDEADIIACDEVQFFMEKTTHGFEIVDVLAKFLRDGKHVIVSGLDKDFRGLPFGPMGDIMALADERISLTSVCARCGAPAVLPQRLIDGRPANFSDPIIYPGASEAYEPRCRSCHIVPGIPPLFGQIDK